MSFFKKSGFRENCSLYGYMECVEIKLAWFLVRYNFTSQYWNQKHIHNGVAAEFLNYLEIY